MTGKKESRDKLEKIKLYAACFCPLLLIRLFPYQAQKTRRKADFFTDRRRACGMARIDYDYIKSYDRAQDLDGIWDTFELRYRKKKITNICISVLIVLLGVSSFIFGWHLEPSITIFRFLTVDGTLFTTAGAAVFVVANVIELLADTEVTRKTVYFIRLSAAVAESVIFIVVMFSQLPFFSQHLPVVDRYDSFVMHVLIPILGIASFLINDSPIGKLKPRQLWHGTWFVTFYAVIVLSLIASEILPTELIPYFFLDFRHVHWSVFAFAFVFVYSSAYLMAGRLSEWNRTLSWLWFKDITAKKGKHLEGTQAKHLRQKTVRHPLKPDGKHLKE